MCVLKKRAAARLAAALPVVALLVTLGVSTARADGYVISQPTPSSPIMAGQRAALIYRDGHEDLVISISLDFRPVQQRPDIAWIIPVPSLPEFRATGNALFDELDRLSAPEIVLPPEGQGALAPGTSAPAPTSTVEVLERTQVGVYDLSVLASRNGGALRDWLNAEGLAIPGALQPTVDAYIAEQWVFVAMRIATDADQAEASSTPPVWLSFDAPQMVYPMRLTGLHSTPLAMRLDILWDHRASLDGFSTEFAGNVQVQAPDPAMAPALNRSFYFTRLFDPAVTPAQMTHDLYPSRAPSDETYRQQIVQAIASGPSPAVHPNLAILAGLSFLGLSVLLVAIAVTIWLLRRRR